MDKDIKFLIPYLNFPVKEIITNWIGELLGLAAHPVRNRVAIKVNFTVKAMTELNSLGKRLQE